MVKRLVRWGLREAFRLLYNELAWAYDGISWLVSGGKWQSWQRAALPHIVGPAVLELGFGTGSFLCVLAQAYRQVRGLELSPYMVRIAQRKLSRAGLSLPLVLGRAQSLPFADSVFDSVVATFPAPFVAELDTPPQVARVLRPGGRLVLVPRADQRRRGLVSRLLDCVYTLSAQRTRLSWVEVLEPAGLCVTVEEIELRGSVVQVVVAMRS